MSNIIHITHYDSPLGNITIASDGKALIGLWFDGQKHFADTIAGMPCKEGPQLPVFADTRRWLDLYFAGERPDFTPRIAPKGTPFRQTVWKILLTIPYGKTMSYGEIAQRVVETMCTSSLQDTQTSSLRVTRMSAQAVGGAVGHNPISLIIPCHRVIGANGSLTGYAGGLDRKMKLLRMEDIISGNLSSKK